MVPIISLTQVVVGGILVRKACKLSSTRVKMVWCHCRPGTFAIEAAHQLFWLVGWLVPQLLIWLVAINLVTESVWLMTKVLGRMYSPAT